MLRLLNHSLILSSFGHIIMIKNMFDKIFGTDILPKTIIRNIDGSYYTADYKIYKEKILSLSIASKCIIVNHLLMGSLVEGL